MPDGSFRDTVVFSIIASEWPTVRTCSSSSTARADRGEFPMLIDFFSRCATPSCRYRSRNT
jgi:hypothetical protein